MEILVPKMDLEMTTMAVSTNPEWHRSELAVAGLGFASGMTTFLVLGAVKLLVYYNMTRGRSGFGQRFPSHLCDRFHKLDREATTSCRCVTFDMLPWYTSTLVTDIIIYPFLAALGLYALHGTPLMESPMHRVDNDEAYTYACSIVLGNLAYRLVLVLSTPGSTCKYKLSIVYITVAIFMYLSIIITREDYVLAALGMIGQLHVLFKTARRVSLHGQRSDCSIWTSNICLVCCLVLCSAMLPLTYLAMAISKQSLLGMCYYSLSVFAFSAAFFAIATLVNIVMALCTTCTDTAYSTDYEAQLLLSTCNTQKPKGHNTFTSISELNITPAIIVKPKDNLQPALAYPFQFPALQTK